MAIPVSSVFACIIMLMCFNLQPLTATVASCGNQQCSSGANDACFIKCNVKTTDPSNPWCLTSICASSSYCSQGESAPGSTNGCNDVPISEGSDMRSRTCCCDTANDCVPTDRFPPTSASSAAGGNSTTASNATCALRNAGPFMWVAACAAWFLI
jgi:hypothetical protein